MLTVGSFTSVFKDNKALKSRKTVEIKVFCMLNWNWSLIRIRIRILKAQKFTDPEGGTWFQRNFA
jgi:hypothetical protein